MGAGAVIFDVSHRTAYRYRSPVAQSHHLIHVEPKDGARQRVIRHNLLIEPAPASRLDVKDYFGNQCSILAIEEEHSELVIHVRSRLEVGPAPTLDFAATMPWDQVQRSAVTPNGELAIGVLQFACQSRQTPTLPEALDYAHPSFASGRPVLDAAWDLTRRIYADFRFDKTATDLSTPLADVLRRRRGVCQDFAHLALACLRGFGIPARYVSGYLLTHPPPGMAKLTGADASHAWLSVWSPETDWVDFDPTNGIVPGEGHITVAYGRDYDDVSPIGGVLMGGGEQSMDVAVDVAIVE